ncbi:MAG: class I SAM-dependent rRNA methyltransferase [Paracoccaceae bacterium]
MTDTETETETEIALRPTVKLRPGKGKRLATGAPWAYADEIAMDRRTRALPPGAVVRLMEGETALGVAAFNGQSQIAARLLDPDPEAEIDTGWFAERLRAALGLRAALYETPFYRLVHAEGDGLPGLVIDRFGDALAIQPNAAWVDRRLEALTEAAVSVTGATRVVVNATARVRLLEGLEPHVTVTAGTLDAPLEVPMTGAIYLADLVGGQKTGLYFDQRPNHAFAARIACGARVLDVFSHVGGFALACLAGGAAEAVAVDSSEPALTLAAEGARRTGVAGRFRAEKADAFAALSAYAAEGAAFDVTICDPPAFAPSKPALANGLRAYERVARLAARTVRPGGWLILCSCSHAVDAESFLRASATGIRRTGRAAQLVHSGRAGPDHPQHPALPETGYLKALAFRLP